MKRLLACTFSLILLNACGGGGGGSPAASNTPASGQSNGSAQYAGICQPAAEKSWVRAHLDDVYLWYREIEDKPAQNYSTPQSYFDALLVSRRDRFSFTAPQSDIDDFFDSGAEISYGLNYLKQGELIRIAYNEPGSPAELAGIRRGANLLSINGAPLAQYSASQRKSLLNPHTLGASARLLFQQEGSLLDVTLQAQRVVKAPVQNVKVISSANGKRVGYLQFNDHISSAENLLRNAFMQFVLANVDELVLDLRYNGGGYLDIASQVASMSAGPVVQGKVFERQIFNDKHSAWTNDPASTLGFRNTTSDGRQLPQLAMKRVFVLSSADTCSASEAIINGLRPFVPVITIGRATCGKPYGFYQENNCGTAYFAVEFYGVNQNGQSVPTEGMAATCAVEDDLSHALGDSREGMLAAALYYIERGSCPSAAQSRARQRNLSAALLERSAWRSVALRR
ncbi:S41 family peptidase [Massilia sp. W12]|uniref:S41 family peptidase n=1 Tax=Massilia sp. W12 TaxID=3126507 RepID=UPI0030CE7ABF